MLSKRRRCLELLVNAFAPPAPLRVLELGCGSGINAKFFAQRGDDYIGMDRDLAVDPRFVRWGRFIHGNYCSAIPGGFDLICDRGGFVCNSDRALERAVHLILEALNPGGMFIAADLFTEGNPSLKNPDLRWFTLEGLKALFAPFETVHLADTKALHRFDFVGRKGP